MKRLIVLGVLISVLHAGCSSERVRGAKTPDELVAKFNQVAPQKDGYVKVTKLLVPADRGGWTGIQVLMTDQLVSSLQMMASLSSGLTGTMVNGLTKMASGFGATDSDDEKQRQEAVKEAEEAASKKTASLKKVKKDFRSLLTKRGVDIKALQQVAEQDFADFPKLVAALGKEMGKVEHEVLLAEIQQFIEKLDKEMVEQDESPLRPLVASSLKVDADRATVDTQVDAGGAKSSAVLVKLDGTWFVSLREGPAAFSVLPQEEEVEVGGEFDKAWHLEIDKKVAQRQEALQKAYVGKWQGPRGKIQIKQDGTADFSVKACRGEIVEPGFAKMNKDCAARDYEGKLELNDPWDLRIADEKGADGLFAAYIDKDDKFHVITIGKVGYVGPDRRGRVKVGMTEQLLVGDKCYLFDTFWEKTTPTKCEWKEVNGRSLLIAEVTDTFDFNKKTMEGLVYLKEEGLLVSPSLYESAYDRVK